MSLSKLYVITTSESTRYNLVKKSNYLQTTVALYVSKTANSILTETTLAYRLNARPGRTYNTSVDSRDMNSFHLTVSNIHGPHFATNSSVRLTIINDINKDNLLMLFLRWTATLVASPRRRVLCHKFILFSNTINLLACVDIVITQQREGLDDINTASACSDSFFFPD